MSLKKEESREEAEINWICQNFDNGNCMHILCSFSY
jgi:hypothetical protein